MLSRPVHLRFRLTFAVASSATLLALALVDRAEPSGRASAATGTADAPLIGDADKLARN